MSIILHRLTNILRECHDLLFQPKNRAIAKVLGVDDRTDIAVVVIDGEQYSMDWQAFLKEFKSLCSVGS